MINFKKLKKSLVAVAFALSFCFSGVVNVISALDGQYYVAIANQLAGDQMALNNLQLIRDWHDRHPLDNPDRARDFVAREIRKEITIFKEENASNGYGWHNLNNVRIALGRTLIFAVLPEPQNLQNFQNNMIFLCTRLTTKRLCKEINYWDEEISWIGRNSGDATLATANL